MCNVSCARVSEPSADPEDLALLSPDEREKRRSFEAKSECVIKLFQTIHVMPSSVPGKKHYNEFMAVKMARQLMNEDEDDDDTQDDIGDGGAGGGEKAKHSDSDRTNSPMDTGPGLDSRDS